MYGLTLQRIHEGWPSRSGDTAPSFPVVELGDAFAARYEDHRHIWPGFVVDAAGAVMMDQPRIRVDSVEPLLAAGFRPVISCLMADIDGPGHAATDAWRNDMVGRFASLPPHGWYASRNGFRVLMVPDRPITLEEWPAARDGFWSILRDKGIEPDTACSSWAWLYALPYTRRGEQDLDMPAEWSKVAPVQLNWIMSNAPAGSTALASNVATVLRGGAADVVDLRTGVIVGDGQRTAAMTRQAGKLRAQGLPASAIEAALLALNNECCNPPLPEAKVKAIAASIARYEPRETIEITEDVEVSKLTTDELVMRDEIKFAMDATIAHNRSPMDGCLFRLGSDVEFSNLLLAALDRDTAPVLADESGFWRYCPRQHYWKRVHRSTVHMVQASLDGERVFGGLDKTQAPQSRPVILNHVKIRDSTKVATDQRFVEAAWETRLAGAPFQNGVVTASARGGLKLTPHSPGHRLRWQLPYDADLSNAMPVEFIAGLRRIFRDTPDAESQIQLFREWIGLTLLGLATSNVCAKALLLLGDGNNGKTTTIEIVGALFPKDATVSVSPQNISREYYAARLAGAAINLVTECDTTEMIQASNFKAAITGDILSCRHPYGRPFETNNRAGFLIAANMLMPVAEHTPAFWRRWAALHFNRKFLPHEEDHGWKQRVLDAELPAIAVWAIGGAVDAMRRGALHNCPTSVGLVTKWRQETDQVQGFLIDCCVPSMPTADQGTPMMVLYAAYGRWADATGRRKVSLRHFHERIIGLGVAISEKIRAASNAKFAAVTIVNQTF